jgi:hypothetical protein
LSTNGNILLGVSCCDDVRRYVDPIVCLGGVCPLALAEFVLNLDSKYKEGFTANIRLNKILKKENM